jgi:hypothetical protein
MDLIDKIEKGEKNIIENDIFCLDKYYDEIISGKLLENRKIVNKYPNLNKMIYAYQKLQKKVFASKKDELAQVLIELKENEETFEYIFGRADSYFNVIWHIEKLKEIIDKNNIESVEIETGEALQLLTEERIETIRFENRMGLYKEQSSVPIIIGLTPYSNVQGIVIDGNHRLIRKYDEGEHSTISVYMLDPMYHVRGMVSDIYRTFYISSINIGTTFNYMLGHSNKTAFQNSIVPLINKSIYAKLLNRYY